MGTFLRHSVEMVHLAYCTYADIIVVFETHGILQTHKVRLNVALLLQLF